jgi:outer membrane immunogenic protein
MNAPSVPVRMIVSRWITTRKQLTNAKRPTIAGNERAPNRALNSARPGRKNILSAPTEAPASGGAFGVNTITASAGGGSASVREPGFLGGAQVGANYQTGTMVWGFEADYDASTQNKSLPAGILTGSTSQTPWFATGTAGGAAGELRSIVNIPVGTTSTTVTYGTWIAGAGVEYGITDNLSARVEYLYFDKNNIVTGLIGPPTMTITSHLQDNLVRVGLNYRFTIAR